MRSSLAADWRAQLREYYPPLELVDDRTRRPPALQVGEDLRLADPLLGADPAGVPPQPVFRVWTNERCLVATRREERLPGFESARAASEARGWPVVVRESGGTMVPHLPTFLQLSLILPRRRNREPGADQVYRLLAEPVREVLREMGVEADYGTVPRSFCDGRYNLVSRGRKLAGTAQRWRGGLPGHPVRGGLILSHLTLFAAGDVGMATEAVNRFLRDVGEEGDFDPRASVSVAEARWGRRPTARDENRFSRELRGALLEVLSRD
jgi:octanoyl-[GcvH]:protein N-octanoyltransferase